MNKRSAIAIAGGVTGALVSGVAGYSIRVHETPGAPAAVAATKPIVRTETRTITIHKEAKPHAIVAAPPPVSTVVIHRAPTVVHVAPGPAAQPPVHHTGGSAHKGGEHDDGGDGGDGGGD